jgi:multicomponent Na+:H+ antiporter subunit G
MPVVDLLALALMLAGGAFFFAGTVGFLRFPDVYCRLHALTKVDNLGLGLVLAGLALRAGTPGVALKLLLIWLLVLVASTTSCHLSARAARHLGVKPWRRT